MERNFPQIDLHGGEATITNVDIETRRISIVLTGACSGCGVSPMTTAAIQARLPAEIDEIDYVDVQTGFDGLTAPSRDMDTSDVPF